MDQRRAVNPFSLMRTRGFDSLGSHQMIFRHLTTVVVGCFRKADFVGSIPTDGSIKNALMM